MKNCCWFALGKCEEINPQAADNFARDRKRHDGRTVHCKSCLRKIRAGRREYQSAYSKKWRKENPEKCRAYLKTKDAKKNARVRKKRYILKCRYGLTIEQWNDIFEEQKGICPICLLHMDECVKKELHVDHCHKTGKVRGLLCSTCNKALGLFHDDFEMLERAIVYLKRGTE